MFFRLTKLHGACYFHSNGSFSFFMEGKMKKAMVSRSVSKIKDTDERLRRMAGKIVHVLPGTSHECCVGTVVQVRDQDGWVTPILTKHLLFNDPGPGVLDVRPR